MGRFVVAGVLLAAAGGLRAVAGFVEAVALNLEEWSGAADDPGNNPFESDLEDWSKALGFYQVGDWPPAIRIGD